jgi:hypothetical protein
VSVGTKRGERFLLNSPSALFILSQTYKPHLLRIYEVWLKMRMHRSYALAEGARFSRFLSLVSDEGESQVAGRPEDLSQRTI